MKFRDMSTEMTEQEIITALYMICPDSLYKRYKREKGYISVWYSLPNDTETDKHHLELLPDNVYIFDNGIEQELTDGDAFFRYHQLTVAKGYLVFLMLTSFRLLSKYERALYIRLNQIITRTRLFCIKFVLVYL